MRRHLHTDHTLKLPLYLEGTFAAFGGTHTDHILKLPLSLEGTFAAVSYTHLTLPTILLV